MANDYLRGIADRMKVDALARPGQQGVKHQFTNGAVARLIFDGGEFKLRLARQGDKPSEPKSIRAWDTECETFRRAYGVPDNAPQREDAVNGFYFRIYAFPVALQPRVFDGVGNVARPL